MVSLTQATGGERFFFFFGGGGKGVSFFCIIMVNRFLLRFLLGFCVFKISGC